MAFANGLKCPQARPKPGACFPCSIYRAEGRRIGITLSRYPLSRMDFEALKRQAAARALERVRPGMRLGLGTGSTARHFVDLLGEKVRERPQCDWRADLGSHARAGQKLRHYAVDPGGDAGARPDHRRRRRNRPGFEPDQGRRRRVVAGEDRGLCLGQHDRDRRRIEMGARARAFPAADRNRAFWHGGDAPGGRAGCAGCPAIRTD